MRRTVGAPELSPASPIHGALAHAERYCEREMVPGVPLGGVEIRGEDGLGNGDGVEPRADNGEAQGYHPHLIMYFSWAIKHE